MGGGSIECDDSRAPLYLYRFCGPLSDEQFATYLRACTRVVQLRRPYGIVLDLSEFRQSDIRQSHMRAQGEWLKEHLPLIQAHCAGAAFVFVSPAFRFLLSAIFLIQPLPMPYHVCGTTEEGVGWVAERLARAVAATGSAAMR